MVTKLKLEPWSEGDLWLIQGTLGDAGMTKCLGDPETPEKMARRDSSTRTGTAPPRC